MLLLAIFIFYSRIAFGIGDAFPWLLELEIDKKSPKFQGSVFIRFESDGESADRVDGSRNNFKTEEQMFDIQFKPGDVIHRDLSLSFSDLDIDIRAELFFASFSCDKRRKLLPVRLQAIRLISGSAGRIYFANNIVPRTEHAIGQCADAAIFQDFTIIEKWIVADSTMCFFDGKFYKPSANIKAGCRQKCQCRQGTVACAPQCKDDVQPDAHVICRSMNALGECCPRVECQRNSSNFLNVVKCENPKMSLSLNDEAELAVPPWSYFIIVNRYSANNAASWCGATLVDERWILTPAHCLYTADSPDKHYVLSSPNFIEIYKPDPDQGSVAFIGQIPASKVLAIEVHPSYQRPGDATQAGRRYSSFDFALLKLNPPIRSSQFEQPINLPWTSECYQFVDNVRCQISSTRFFNDTNRLTFEPFLASSVVLPNGQCHKGPAFFCYDQSSEKRIKGPRRGSDGSGAVVKRNGFYELIGMILNNEEDWRSSENTTRQSFQPKTNVLTICEILQWINTTVTSR